MSGRIHVWLLALGDAPDPEGAIGWLRALLSDVDAVTVPWPGLLRRLWSWWTVWREAPLLADQSATPSPLVDQLERQARALQRVLGPHYDVRPVLRYAGPSATQAAMDLRKGDRVVLLPADAQVGGPTTISPLLHARRSLAGRDVPVAEVRGYPDHADYVEALAETLRVRLLDLPDDAGPYEVIFCARGLRGDPGPYPEQARATAAAVVKRTRLARPWHLAFSRPPGARRSSLPRVDRLVTERGRAGVRTLILVPLGYTTEQRDTVVALDRDVAAAAREAGVTHLLRADTVATRPTFLRALADLVHDAEARAGWDLPWASPPGGDPAPPPPPETD